MSDLVDTVREAETERLADELEAELERAARDGITVEEAPEVQGDGTALGGYLAGVARAVAIVRGES